MDCDCKKVKSELLSKFNNFDKKLRANAEKTERETAMMELGFLEDILPIAENAIRCMCYDGQNLAVIKDILKSDKERIINKNLDPRNIQKRYMVIKNNILTRHETI